MFGGKGGLNLFWPPPLPFSCSKMANNNYLNFKPSNIANNDIAGRWPIVRDLASSPIEGKYTKDTLGCFWWAEDVQMIVLSQIQPLPSNTNIDQLTPFSKIEILWFPFTLQIEILWHPLHLNFKRFPACEILPELNVSTMYILSLIMPINFNFLRSLTAVHYHISRDTRVFQFS